MSRRLRTALTVTDQFCGAGGSSIGAVAAGAELRMAMNHWQLAIDTHASNFKDAEHVCADIHSVDPRRYAPTDILITSPECTWHSLARARKRSAPLFEPPDPSGERSRATMWDVPRFAEHHGYQLVIVENVVEVLRWPPFDAWLGAMTSLGYAHRVVSLNSFAAPPTPQSRDRVYVVFWRKGNRAPDLDIRVNAWCPRCERVVQGVQAWKGARNVGKYRQQYVYRCASCNGEAFPYVAPAASAIDWALPAGRIGDRARPLKPATIRRIEEGLRRYARPLLAQVGGHTFERPGYARAWPVDQPAPAQMATPHHGLVVPLRTNGRAQEAGVAPLPAFCAGGTHHGLVVPLSQTGANGTLSMARSTDQPMGTQTARQDVALVVTQRQRENGRVHAPDDPLTTVTTSNQHALVMGNRTGSTPRPVDEVPMPTACTGNTLALIFGAYGGNTQDGGTRPVTDPMTVVTAKDHHALLVPYYGTGVARPTGEPAGTVTTRDRHALVEYGEPPRVDDCTFRMLEPHEIQAAMAFPRDYVVLGNKRDRVRQLGNAVTPPAMSELIRRCVASMDGDAA